MKVEPVDEFSDDSPACFQGLNVELVDESGEEKVLIAFEGLKVESVDELCDTAGGWNRAELPEVKKRNRLGRGTEPMHAWLHIVLHVSGLGRVVQPVLPDCGAVVPHRDHVRMEGSPRLVQFLKQDTKSHQDSTR